MWQRVWLIPSSICAIRLWMQRNKVTFQHETVSLAGSVADFWANGMRQLRAIGKREFRQADTQRSGARLLLCQRHISKPPREMSPLVTSHDQPPDSYEEPTLLARLYVTGSHGYSVFIPLVVYHT